MSILASRRTLFAALFGFAALAGAGSASAQTTPAPAPAAPAPAPLTAEERARYIGNYDVELDGNRDVLVIYEENGNLIAQPPGMSRPSQLNRKEGHVFEPVVAPGATFTFKVDAQGKVTGFALVMPDGMQLEGTRQP